MKIVVWSLLSPWLDQHHEPWAGTSAPCSSKALPVTSNFSLKSSSQSCQNFQMDKPWAEVTLGRGIPATVDQLLSTTRWSLWGIYRILGNLWRSTFCSWPIRRHRNPFSMKIVSHARHSGSTGPTGGTWTYQTCKLRTSSSTFSTFLQHNDIIDQLNWQSEQRINFYKWNFSFHTGHRVCCRTLVFSCSSARPDTDMVQYGSLSPVKWKLCTGKVSPKKYKFQLPLTSLPIKPRASMTSTFKVTCGCCKRQILKLNFTGSFYKQIKSTNISFDSSWKALSFIF